ncbi:DMT family transporter [Novosphingobium lentum]|uniref:DMT family transporter n=1 Tax=Novosphingobium lentum TaxID=145287 RepID=UPI000835D3B4|nr:DMT family transporter [Novosphingobium lentum]
MARHTHFLPIVVAIAGLCLFGVMDGAMKAAAIAEGAYAAMFWRGLVGAALMLPLWLWRGQGWPSRAVLRLHLTRSAVAAVMAVLFFYGLVRTPMADAMALSFIAPLIALYLAAATLGETIGRRAIVGSTLGLVGVVVIAAGKLAGHAYEPEAVKGLFAILGSAVLYAWNLVLQRRQAQLARPEEIAFFQTAIVFCILGLGAPWLAPLPHPGTWIELVAAAVLSTGSLMLLGWAYARAEAQVLVPMEYTAFIWAALVGWVAFHEPLTLRTMAGVVLIVAGCLIAARGTHPLPEPG